MKRRLLLVISLAVLCIGAAPASADLFDFVYGNIRSDYTKTGDTTGTFSSSVNKDLTWGTVTRQEAPIQQATFSGGSWGAGLGPDDLDDFTLSMDITSISNIPNALGFLTADGEGSFILTDTGGDTITGGFSGQWMRYIAPSAPNVFGGTMSNVTAVVSDGKFDGHSGSVLMSFSVLPPWYGTLIELNFDSIWFGVGDYSSDVSSVHASVVPAPAAVILGILGLGVVGWKLRKYA